MILCPIQNTSSKMFDWIGVFIDWKQQRPRITQTFGKNPQIYSQFGMKGHNGIDYGVPVGTPIFAPFSGWVKAKNDSGGYGKHIKIRSKEKRLECCLGHLIRFNVKNGDYVNMGDVIGLSGNTGFSTGPHLHFGIRTLLYAGDKDVFKWPVDNYNNGYFGYWDQLPYTITWKGTSLKNNLP